MRENNFVFADLSTYEITTSIQFYSHIFDWEYQDSGGDYFIATYNNQETSGLYETPKKFREMNMPSFWMSYIEVTNLEETVQIAKESGGIIELVDLTNEIGKIALIRDPLGAGFTIYEGDQLNSRTTSHPNTLVWNELFISDLSKVIPFYEKIFNWRILPSKEGRAVITNSKNEEIAAIQEAPTSQKGKYEYWGVFFAVENIEKTKKKVLDNGGHLLYEGPHFTALSDSFGAFFQIVAITSKSSPVAKSKTTIFPWKAISGIFLILASILLEWHWVWSLFFVLWIVFDIRSGKTHLFETVSKKDTPIVYWSIILLWAGLSLIAIYYPLKR